MVTVATMARRMRQEKVQEGEPRNTDGGNKRWSGNKNRKTTVGIKRMNKGENSVEEEAKRTVKRTKKYRWREQELWSGNKNKNGGKDREGEQWREELGGGSITNRKGNTEIKMGGT